MNKDVLAQKNASMSLWTLDRYNNYKKPESSQQARRGSNYQLSVDNRLLQET